MRLTVDHIRRAPQFTNTMLQRELDLRGLCISVLDENPFLQLQNDFDVINLCSNAITTLESFPVNKPQSIAAARNNLSPSETSSSQPMSRINTIIAHRNKIQRVSVATCVQAFPFLKFFAAERNNFSSVKDLLFLRYWKELEAVSLLNNPVWRTNPENFTPQEIRALLCYMCPKLRLIDNERVTRLDREAAIDKSSKFDVLLHQFTGDASNREKKIRKRGRAAAVESGPHGGVSPSSDGISSSGLPLLSHSNEEDREEERKLKLARLEERINADDISPEEFDELEREIMKLSQNL